MKRVSLLFLFLAVNILPAIAQESYGPEAGINVSNYVGKSNGQTVNTTSAVGIKLGWVDDNKLGSNFYIQYGFSYVMNGYKISDAIDNETVRINTLEIPINVLCKANIPGGDKFFIGFGPYFALNLSGTVKDNYSNGGSNSSALSIGSNATDDLKVFDFGLGFNLGYQLKTGFFLRGNYQFGLLNLEPMGDANNIEKSTAFSITAGYLFKSKRHNKEHSKSKSSGEPNGRKT